MMHRFTQAKGFMHVGDCSNLAFSSEAPFCPSEEHGSGLTKACIEGEAPMLSTVLLQHDPTSQMLFSI